MKLDQLVFPRNYLGILPQDTGGRHKLRCQFHNFLTEAATTEIATANHTCNIQLSSSIYHQPKLELQYC